MRKIPIPDQGSLQSADMADLANRENNWCEKYGYFIDLDACRARSLNRPVCRRCYKSLVQLSLSFGDA